MTLISPSSFYRRRLFPSFLLDAFRLTGMDQPILFRKICLVLISKTNKLKLKNAFQPSSNVGQIVVVGKIHILISYWQNITINTYLETVKLISENE